MIERFGIFADTKLRYKQFSYGGIYVVAAVA